MVKYLCDICNRRYSVVSEAEACEKQGILGQRYQPGLTLIRTDTQAQGLFENLMIILKREKPRGHDRIYLTGITTFGVVDEPPGSFFLDHWECSKYTGREIEQRIREGDLRRPTDEEFGYIEGGLHVWMGEMERSEREPLVYPLQTDIRTDIIHFLKEYQVIIHRKLLQ